MAILTINQSVHQQVNVDVSFSDQYTKKAYVTLTRSETDDEDSTNCNVMLISADELEKLGKFLVDQANIIRIQSMGSSAVE